MTKPPRSQPVLDEVPDSEDESSVTVVKPDEGAMTTSSPLATACNTAGCTPAASSPITATSATTATTPTQATQPVVRAERKALSASSARAPGVQEKIRQLHSSIEHTKQQLCEALDKISTNQQGRLHVTSQAKPPVPSNSPLSDLSSEQQQSLGYAQAILDQHIKQLGKYNQLKDIAMGMLGIVAEREGKTMLETMVAREIEDDD